MNLKNLYLTLDIIFGTIWGFTLVDLIPLILLSNTNQLFANLDNSIKVMSAFVGLVYFAFRIYFYYHKSKNEIEYLKQQTKELEIKNIQTENANFLFRKEIEIDMSREEFEKSKERLTKHK